jgi:hypothetical protein
MRACTRKPPLPARLSALVIVVSSNQGVQQADDALLPGGRCVELAPNFDESSIDMRPQVGNVLAHRAVHSRVLLTEIADLRAHIRDIAVRATGQD